MSSEKLNEQVAGLLGGEAFTLEPIPGGANNRVYKVKAKEKNFLLKVYFQHPADTRDRLGAEYSFVSFAWGAGIRSIPAPVAADRKNNLALYEFIDGKKPAVSDVTEKAVAQALNLFIDINRYKAEPAAAALPLASEARFSIAGHLECIDSRVKNLSRLKPESGPDEAAKKFVERELLPAWAAVKTKAAGQAGKLKLPLEAEIDRRLSPSDFGFHNALVTPDGAVKFIDFEYAGWDDPAKMVCDFFCQQAVPVDFKYLDKFAGGVAATLSDPALNRKKIELLLPVYEIKWCCILLNEFLPAGRERRRYAMDYENYEGSKQAQLDKTRDLLERIKL
ncbi:MAG: aminoglycoside phosphotransferase family protein [Candidatus Margulisbacteria bacterium]|nr:aminoglycoside phosphotransferase family protein [Candidatus Margulisiibacteriota bacterium]